MKIKINIKKLNFQDQEDRSAMSPQDKLIAQYGDFGQANRLLSSKKRFYFFDFLIIILNTGVDRLFLIQIQILQ